MGLATLCILINVPSPYQVYWQSDDQPKELNFFSISSDGRVASWVMSKNELKMEPVMQLKLVNTIKVKRKLARVESPWCDRSVGFFGRRYRHPWS